LPRGVRACLFIITSDVHFTFRFVAPGDVYADGLLAEVEEAEIIVIFWYVVGDSWSGVDLDVITTDDLSIVIVCIWACVDWWGLVVVLNLWLLILLWWRVVLSWSWRGLLLCVPRLVVNLLRVVCRVLMNGRRLLMMGRKQLLLRLMLWYDVVYSWLHYPVLLMKLRYVLYGSNVGGGIDGVVDIICC
jgi:hypothetical protein